MQANEQAVRAIRKSEKFVATDSFQPLEHFEVLDAVELAMNNAGLHIHRDECGLVRSRFTVVDQGAKMTATLPLASQIDNESRLQVAIMNSWNKTLSLRVGFGSEVFVCTNGAFHAAEIIGRKHTTHILNDLPHLLSEALGKLDEYAEMQKKFFARLRNVQMIDNEVSDFVVRSALDHGCITNGEIADVVQEWRQPRYDEFKPRVAWSLFNAYTEVGKRIQNKNGNIHTERMVRLSGLFSNTFASDLGLPVTSPDELAETEVA